jgi:dihydroflavonol-4-reductase
MKIVITGSSGFIGKNLMEEVERRFSEAEILCLVRNSKNLTSRNRIKFLEVDYLDRESLLNCIAFEQVDYVYHVAGVTKSVSKKGFWEGNVLPTKHLLETLVRRNTIPKRFILVSSQTASGASRNRDHYRREDEPENPLELYGQSKLEAERQLREYVHTIPFTIISPAGVYGPWDTDFYNIFKMTKYDINIFAGNKNQVVSLVYVKDLVKAIVDASLSKNAEYQKYFICNDEPKSWEEIQNTIFNSVGRKKVDINIPLPIINALSYVGSCYSTIVRKPILLNRNKVRLLKSEYWIFSNQKAKTDFSFSCNHSFVEGIKETYDWYKEHHWL